MASSQRTYADDAGQTPWTRSGGSWSSALPTRAAATEAAPIATTEAAPAATGGVAEEASGQRLPSARYPKSGSWSVLWQVCTAENCWSDYDAEFCTELERRYDSRNAADKEYIATPKGRLTFKYDLKGMYQENLVTSTRRVMRRLLIWPEDFDSLDVHAENIAKHNKENADPTKARRETRSESRTRERSQGAQRKGSGRGSNWRSDGAGWQSR